MLFFYENVQRKFQTIQILNFEICADYARMMKNYCCATKLTVAVFLLLTIAKSEDVVKRSAASDETISYDYPEYQIGVKYDEYPVRLLF